MKKFNLFVSLAVLAVSAALVGCGSSEPEAKPPTDAPKMDDTKPSDGGTGGGGATGTTPGTPPSTMGGPTND